MISLDAHGELAIADEVHEGFLLAVLFLSIISVFVCLRVSNSFILLL